MFVKENPDRKKKKKDRWPCYYGKKKNIQKQKNTIRYIGNIPFCYLIHSETRDHKERTGAGKNVELSKALP